MENGHEPATKQDIAELKTELKQDVAGVQQDVSGLKPDVSELKQDVSGLRSEIKQEFATTRFQMQHAHRDLKETFLDSRDKTLKAFCNCAQNANDRIASVENERAAHARRLAAVETQLTKVEMKLTQA